MTRMYPSATFTNWGFGYYPISRQWKDFTGFRKHILMTGHGEAIIFDAGGHPERIWWKEKKTCRGFYGDLNFNYFVAYMDGRDQGDEDPGEHGR